MTPPADLALDAAPLAPLVRTLLAAPQATVATWTARLLSRQGRRSVYRIAGTAADGGQDRPWALVLKVLQSHPADRLDAPTSWAYWEREALVYQAGLVDDLPGGLRAPRCYGVEQRAGGHWMWLEALDGPDPPWPVARYGLAATHLGTFNGAFFGARRRPQAPWLSRAWLRDRTADLPARLALVADPATWAHPLLRRAFPVPVAERCLAVAARREAWLAQIARLPVTFCHLDAWRGNLFAGTAADGHPETIAIDWAFTGYAPPGQEISPVVWAALLEFLVDATPAAALEETVVESYLAALHAAGWRGDPRAVRFAYLASALLQWATVPEALLYACDPAEGEWAAAHWGRPRADIVAASAAVTYALLDRVAAADALAAALA
jgi:hypothetical protein